MVKTDKKAKAIAKKSRVAEKQSKKATQKEKKAKVKSRDEDSDAEDIDLDAVLAEYAKQQAQFLKVTEVICAPPSPRSSSTLIGSPSNSRELFIFGGEYYNGALATFFNDLFIYSVGRDEWKLVTSPNSPLPRSGHAWCRGGNAGGIYLFGGEFSSPKQGTFYHYNDFWRLDTLSREWTRLETKGKGPPARSGHRMTFFKNYILLFGGFQDTSQQTKYLQDLWIYDCQNFVWHNPSLPPATQKPDARSSFSFLPHDLGAVIYGGYSRVKATTTAGKQTKGGGQGLRTVLKPVVHQDTWILRILQPSSDASSTSPPTVRWERRKRPANPANPPRAGATMAYHKGRGILFGGVHDVEESDEGIESEFFDALFAWNVERNRYFQLTLRRPRGPNKKQLAADRGGGKRGKGKADEEELLRNLAALETKGSIEDAEQMDIEYREEDQTPTKSLKELSMEMPHPRFNVQLAVQEDILYMFGGTFEKGDREYTFDEMWAIDLNKLDGVREIFKRELENWEGSEDEESEVDDEDDLSTDEDESDEDTLMEGTPIQEETPRTSKSKSKQPKPNRADLETLSDITTIAETESLSETAPTSSSLDDSLPHPRPFENLREFSNRTSNQWQEIVLSDLQKESGNRNKSIKELRKIAFEKAESKWWDCREEIRALEDEQEEAGIGEVVSISDRGGEAGPGAGVRRR
ncbi:MAG: hypothetical protein M1812_001613 [Candelaria pacifica]|nr:MAG: hypothetical protein M1812_001613 [Candelaria pacifica]